MSDLLDLDHNKEEEIPYNPARNPSQQDYDREFNNITSTPANQALNDQADSAARDNFAYSHDPERQAIANQEGKGGGLYKPNKELSKANDAAGERGAVAKTLGNSKSRIAGMMSGGGWKKKAAIGAIGATGGGGIIVLIFILFMLMSGFGIGQVAMVMKNYEYARFYSDTYENFVRLFEADASVKADPDLGLQDVSPSSSIEKLRGFDAGKYMENLERSDTITYKSEGGSVDKITIKGGGGGGEDVTLDIPRNGVRGIGDRADFSTKLKGALENASPELKETGFVNKTADTIFERLGIERYRWEKAAEKFRGKDEKTSFKEAQEESYDRTRGDPKEVTASTDAQKDTQEALKKGVDKNIEDGVPRPVEQAKISDIAEIKGRIGSQKLSQKAGGIAIAAFFMACTANGLADSYTQTREQETNAMQRGAGLTQSAYDQYKSGDTSAEAVGAETKLNDGFADQAQYQKDIYNPNWQQYEGLAPTDYPQKSPTGALAVFTKVGTAASTGWEMYKKLPTDPLSALVDIVGVTTGHGPGAWSFAELCNTVTKPQVAIPAGIIQAVIAIILAIPSGGTSVAAESGGTAVADGAGTTVVDEGLDAVAQKTSAQLLKDFITHPIGYLKDNFTISSWGRMATAAAKFAGENGAFIGMALLMENMADINTNNVCSGTSDSSRYNCSAAGSNLLNSNLERSNNFGRPLTTQESGQLAQIQYSDYIASQSQKSFTTRFFSLKDPYSATSRIAANISGSSSGIKQSTTTGYASAVMKYANPFTLLAQAGPLSIPTGVAFAADNDTVTEANTGIEQWGYSADEQAKIGQPGYSMVDISQWAYQNASFVQSMDDKYLACFDASKDWYNLPDNCQSTNFSSDDMLKWRLYHRDINTVDGAIDLQTVTEDSSQSTTTTTAGSTIDMSNIYNDSSDVACAPNTTDLGIQQGYRGGNEVNIRACAISNLPSTAEESTSISGANGKLVVNSRVSGAVYAMVEAAIKDGVSPSATSGFRTMAHQQELYACAPTCTGGNPAAKPGTSNHQMGLAIDTSGAMNTWMKTNSEEFGFKWYGTGDPVHFSVDGK